MTITKITAQELVGFGLLVRLLNNGTKVPAPNGYLIGIVKGITSLKSVDFKNVSQATILLDSHR